jgi:hypothetical protein
VTGTCSGPCPVVAFGVGGIEPKNSATKQFVR